METDERRAGPRIEIGMPPRPPARAACSEASEAAFVALRDAYRAEGGLAGHAEIGRFAQARGRGGLAGLTRSIAAGLIFAFEWRRCVWLPMFQFEPDDHSIRLEVSRVLAEFAGEFDGWRLACWFVEPNGWLDGARPIDRLSSHPEEVIEAARADRFVAAG
jgi:hypothetical protein